MSITDRGRDLSEIKGDVRAAQNDFFSDSWEAHDRLIRRLTEAVCSIPESIVVPQASSSEQQRDLHNPDR